MNASGKYGNTPLHTSAKYNAHKTAALLIDKGANVNASGKYGNTPLHTSAKYNAHEIAARLISEGASVNARDKDEWTPLHFAAWYNAPETATLLMAKGANISAKVKDGDTPLDYAKKKSAHETQALLLAAQEKARLNQALRDAAKNNDYKLAALLIAEGVDVNASGKYGNTPLNYAWQGYLSDEKTREEYRKVGILLINKGAVKMRQFDGATPLHVATLFRAREIAAQLIDQGADVNATDDRGDTPLHVATALNASEFVAWLIDQGADVNMTNDDGGTPLHIAVVYRSHAMVTLLLASGASSADSSNFISEGGLTPLHWAAWRNAKDTAVRLIDKGADVNGADYRGWTPLHVAVQNNAEETAANDTIWNTFSGLFGSTHKLVTLLIDKGAYVNAADANGMTPLISVLLDWPEADEDAREDIRELATLLIDKGADVNATDDRGKLRGKTLLHGISVIPNMVDLAALLIDLGADVNATDDRGDTPLHSVLYEWANIVRQDITINDIPGAELLDMLDDVATLLIDKGADTRARNSKGETPLDIARASKNWNMAKLLE